MKDLVVGSGLVFDDAGEHELKGIPRPLALAPSGELSRRLLGRSLGRGRFVDRRG